MELDCIQLSPTVPMPPRRQLATCHAVQPHASNRGANAPVPARLCGNVFTFEKNKAGSGWDQGLWLGAGHVRENWGEGISEPVNDSDGTGSWPFPSGVQMLQVHGPRPRFLRWLFQFTCSPEMISRCLGVLGPAEDSDHWSLPTGGV